MSLEQPRSSRGAARAALAAAAAGASARPNAAGTSAAIAACLLVQTRHMPSARSRSSFLAASLVCLAFALGLFGCKSDAAAHPAEVTTSGSTASSPPAAGPVAPAAPAASKYGNPGDPIHLVVGYQPYYAQSWSGVVLNSLGLWKKHLPQGSTVAFEVGLQGAVIVNAMLADKQQIGYLGDTPAIVAATKRDVADLRIVAHIGSGQDQCNVFFVRNDAPQFSSPLEAIRWLHGKTVAVPKGSCTDRFARAVFAREKIEPASYLNQNVELITSGFRAKKLDAAVIWEPTGSRLASEGLARRVASGKDVGESDAAFIDMRADLIEQRPDVVTGWLRAELEAEQFLADPKNSREVARMAKE